MTSDWSQVRIEKLTIYKITLYIFGARVKIRQTLISKGKELTEGENIYIKQKE